VSQLRKAQIPLRVGFHTVSYVVNPTLIDYKQCSLLAQIYFKMTFIIKIIKSVLLSDAFVFSNILKDYA